MWRTELRPSKKQRLLISLFYLLFGFLTLYMFHETYVDEWLFIIPLVVVFEWRKAWASSKLIKRELAIFHPTTEIYWARQRWFIYQKPLFLRYAVVIKIRSKRNNQKRVLFIMYDSLSVSDWRSLNYFLRQMMI